MRVLLTGAAGFIGSHTAEALLRRGDDVIGVDNLNTFYDPTIKRGNIEQVRQTANALAGPDRFIFETLDITDPRALEAVFATHRPDAVIHLAAWAGVRPSIDTPEIYASVNVGGTVNVLETVRRSGIARMVFASSSSVYGGRTTTPFRENDPVDAPISPYAATKKSGELLCATWNHLYGTSIAALRFFTVYGPRQRPEMAIHKFAVALARGESVTMYGDGTTARDYTFIEDIVAGTLAALDRNVGFEVYNLGEERSVRLSDLLEMLAARLEVPLRVRSAPEQPGDVPITSADVSKARTRLGYAPAISIEAGLDRFVAWFRQQPIGRR